jgi:type II secretory pathway predicted ATPase ExeA
MYEAYWQLERRPFEPTTDAQFYYPCEAHQGALLKLRYAIENRRGAALLCGASGVGKTLIVGLLRRQLAESYQPMVHLVFPQMPADELLAYIAEELACEGGAAGPAATIKESVRRIGRALSENDRQGRHAIVVIDEAHLLQERRLGNFQGDTEPYFTLLICGQPALLPMLDRMPQWEERLGVKCLLRPFTLEETMSYISHRLTTAGARSAIFDTPALETVHHLTQGNARRINRLCDLALLIAFAEEQPMITASQIEGVAQELVTVAPE